LPAVEGEVDDDFVDDEDEDDDDEAADALHSNPNANSGKSLRRTQSEIRSRGTAASVKASYVLDLSRELKISGVRDVCFLHGYGEPTVLVLHEKKPTWAGRLALLNDTMVISAITLDLDNKRHTVIWRRANLPHSCYRLCAMPDPLGGALVLSQNFLMHESQESSRALALNPLAGGGGGDETSVRAAKAAADAAALATTAGNAAAQDPSLANPVSLLATREGTESALGVSVELDAAQCAVVSETRVLLTTKNGSLMLLSLRLEGRRLAATGAMRLRRAGGAVLSSGMCLVTRKLLFLGSRVGDSLLVSFTEKVEQVVQALPSSSTTGGVSHEQQQTVRDSIRKRKAGEDVPAERQKENPGDAKANHDDDDELEALLYGDGKTRTVGGAEQIGGDGVGSVGAASLKAAAALANNKIEKDGGYSFTVRDSVLGISPVIDLTIGASVSVRGDTETRAELVAACGHGKNGALAVLQRGTAGRGFPKSRHCLPPLRDYLRFTTCNSTVVN
jgi:cleavage and polyadenylation specificity factor subunit 1